MSHIKYNEDNYKLIENISTGLYLECRNRAFISKVNRVSETAKNMIKNGDEKLENYVFHATRAALLKHFLTFNEAY